MSRVRWEVVTGRQDILLPSGEVIHFSLELEAVTGNLTQEEAGPQHRDLSLVYENTGDGSEGVLTYSPDTGTVQYSTVQYSTARVCSPTARTQGQCSAPSRPGTPAPSTL